MLSLYHLLPLLHKRSLDPALDEDTILSGYIELGIDQPGAIPQERLENLKRTYDSYLNDHLLEVPLSATPPYVTIAEIQAALDERTVLWNFYIGAGGASNSSVSVHCLVATREEAFGYVVRSDIPDSLVRVSAGGASVLMPHIGLLVVQELRQAIVQSPGPRLVSRQAGLVLEQAFSSYLKQISDHFANFRAKGKDHLCIVPHGPFHYFPFHLIGKPGSPLADEWIVTYLPHLHLLLSHRGLPTIRRYHNRTMTVVGLDFKESNPLGVPQLPQAISNCNKVANLFETVPVLNSQATKTRLIEALQNSRFVHLMTHGRHDVHAPAFHCLYLGPEAGSDSRLFAHEILPLDLTGLELLTLGACETALGRFDASDNLRGLPASFLLSGVSAIIGTLWDAQVDAAERFFTLLYSELKSGSNRLDAFASAQRGTRAQYPHYRDWGPFYLIGDWI